MKKIFFLFAALISAMTMSAVTYNVTVPAGTNACYIAGEMTGWSHTEMTKVDDTHYPLELADATEAMKYKYCSGPGWAYVEKTANGEEVADRTYFVEDVVEAWAAVYEPSATPEEPGETKDITVKAKVPAEWTDQITAWVWPTGGNGSEVVPTQEGEWYVYTHNCTELNIIFKNGAGWNGDANQTVDMTFSADACIEITAGSGKATYTDVDCPEGGDTPVDPTPDPETGVTYNVTVPAGTNACYIAGEMNTWSHTEMTKVDETHYTITIAEATKAMKYKYCSGPDWAYVEMHADGVTDVQDRTYAENDVVEAWKAVYTPEGGDTPVDPTPDPEDPKDITVKAKVPAEWTDPITVWVWATGMEGQEAEPTQEGEWYVYTHTGSDLNIIYKNGAGWNGDANQTVDMSFTESACIEITAGAGKATYTVVDCEENPGEEPGDDPIVTPDPEALYYITGNVELLGEELAWKPAAIAMTEVEGVYTHTFTAVAAGVECQLKVTEGDWDNGIWGYDNLSNTPDGVTTNNDRNIIFTLAEDGDVLVTFDGEKITVEGNFAVSEPEPVVMTTIYLNTGGSALWNNSGAKFFAHSWKDGVGVTINGVAVSATVKYTALHEYGVLFFCIEC